MTPPNPALWDPVASRDPETPRPAPHGAPDSALALLRCELARRWPSDADRGAEGSAYGGEENGEADSAVSAIARYALLPAGKLLRPLLLIESAGAVGGRAEDVLAAALGVEYLHVGSLVHDDVIDGDKLRRGRPTVAAHFGTADAIVAGDALMLNVFKAVAECADHGIPAQRLLGAVRVLADAGIDLCHGQSLEEELCGDPGCGLERYLAMASLKTGALFRGACHSGAVLGGGTDEQQGALRQFAEHLGLAFQMSDDLLPYISSTAASGKSASSDVANGRPTFPVLLAYELSGPAGKDRLAAALGGAQPLAEAVASVRKVVEPTGAVRAARERVAAEVERAHRCLSTLPEGPSRDVLASIADLSKGRER
jgi:geranylgeranyl pyrophosphate synthase